MTDCETQKPKHSLLHGDTKTQAAADDGFKPGSEPGSDEKSVRIETGGDKVGEIGGPSGPEPTRFGDWERNGRCIDF